MRGRNQYRLTPVDKEAVIATYQQAPTLTQAQIAKLHSIDDTTVCKILKQYNIDYKQTQDFIKNRADIFAGLQRKIIESISPEDLQKAPLQVKAMAMGVLYDKERLERGQATEITVNFDAIRAIKERARDVEAKIKALERGETIDVTPLISSQPETQRAAGDTSQDNRDNFVQPKDIIDAQCYGDSNEATSDNSHYVNQHDVEPRRRPGRPRKAR